MKGRGAAAKRVCHQAVRAGSLAPAPRPTGGWVWAGPSERIRKTDTDKLGSILARHLNFLFNHERMLGVFLLSQQ